MQIPLLHQQILLETERLRDMHRSIMIHTSPVPAAEMENFLLQIRNLYGLVLQLNNENALQLMNEIQLAINNEMPSLSKPELNSVEESVSVTKIISEEEQKIKTEIKIPEVAQKLSSNGENKSQDKKQVVAGIHKMFHETPTVADRFSDHQTLGEKIAGNDSMKRVSDNLKSSVKDIKSAIGLNEKFQFINQLFNGDSKKYNSVIDELNVSPNAETAMNFVREISESNNWESHPASAKTFIEIIERRFSV